jgi:hypothetical protein
MSGSTRLVIDDAEYPSLNLAPEQQVELTIKGIVIRKETRVVDASGWDETTYLPAGSETELLISDIRVAP